MAGDWIKIRNWDKWQTYRKDRGQPPWIKLHRQLMRDINWIDLNDAQRGQLVAIWLLAADHDGVIPASTATIRKLCYMDDEPDLQLFIDKGFIEGGDILASKRRHGDAPETDKRQIREEKNNTVQNEKKQKDGYSEDFEQFWKSCPPSRKSGKANAWKAWPKALDLAAGSEFKQPEESVAEFLARRMADYSRETATKEPQFIRLPATWLNGGNWDDETGSRVATPEDLKNWRP